MIGHEDTPEELRRTIMHLQDANRRLRRDLDDWKLRFKDRDAYCRVLEAELIPLRRAEVDHEQEAML